MKEMPRTILLGVGLVALSTIVFEVSLTRIFAVTLWYYFGFLAISLALFGMSVAAVWCFVFADRFLGARGDENLSKFSLWFSIFAPVAVYVHINLNLAGYYIANINFYLILALQLCLLSAAFFASGMCISIALFRYGKDISKIYFFDLVGASIGSLLIVPVLYAFSPLSVTFLVAALAALSGWLFARKSKQGRLRTALLVLAILNTALFLVNDHIGPLKISMVKSYGGASLQQPEERKVFEKWSPISRVAVFAPKKTGTKQEFMKVTNDAGAPTVLHKFDGDFSNLEYLHEDSRQTVHHLKSGSDVLIIGSGGGRDVLSALAFNQARVTAVEINSVIGELVTKNYARYIGDIFKDPRVEFHVQEGRNFVAGAQRLFDIIQITMIDSWSGAAAGAYIFNENSLYTKEAIRDYVTHLKPDGILSITRYYEWDEALRLSNMMIAHLEESGINDAENRIAIVLEKPRSYRRATVLLKNGVFSKSEIQSIMKTAKEGGFSVIYVPGPGSDVFEAGDYASTFRAFINPGLYGKMDRDNFVSSYPRNIRPATDNKPFFFFTAYFKDVFQSDPREHAARRLAMPILYGMFGTFGVFGALAIILPLYWTKRMDVRRSRFRIRSLVYFAMLGIGYMLVETSLIQRLTIFLGHPTYSFVVVLSSLLCASGLGSFVSGRWSPQASPRKLATVLAGIIILLFVCISEMYDQFIQLMWLAKPYRILLAVATMVPPGFLMGMCFPMGMQIARKFHEHLIPWGWGVNGAFSVFASVSSLVLALNFGLKETLAIGWVCYIIAFLIVLNIKKQFRVQKSG